MLIMPNVNVRANFVRTITILSYSNSKPSDGRAPSQKLINLTFKNVQEKRTKKSEVNSQKLIKTFLQTDQGKILIGKRGICRFCGDEFTEEKDMNKHIILDHKENPFEINGKGNGSLLRCTTKIAIIGVKG